MAMGGGIYKSGLMSPKEVELLSIALDASVTHMYAPGTRRHIQNALKAGATMEEIMEVLKLCVVQGVQTFNRSIWVCRSWRRKWNATRQTRRLRDVWRTISRSRIWSNFLPEETDRSRLKARRSRSSTWVGQSTRRTMLVFTTEYRSEFRSSMARSSRVEDTAGNMMSPPEARTLCRGSESPPTL